MGLTSLVVSCQMECFKINDPRASQRYATLTGDSLEQLRKYYLPYASLSVDSSRWCLIRTTPAATL